jgi:glutamate-1-semialdehyde 2,1-aminomutase
MFSLFFTATPVTDAASARATDRRRFQRCFARLLDAGVLLAPSPLEACFFSAAHGEAEVARLVDGVREAPAGA